MKYTEAFESNWREQKKLANVKPSDVVVWFKTSYSPNPAPTGVVVHVTSTQFVAEFPRAEEGTYQERFLKSTGGVYGDRRAGSCYLLDSEAKRGYVEQLRKQTQDKIDRKRLERELTSTWDRDLRRMHLTLDELRRIEALFSEIKGAHTKEA